MQNPFPAEIPRVGQTVRFLNGNDTIDAMVVRRQWNESGKHTMLGLADGTDLIYQNGKWTYGEGPYTELLVVND